MRRSETAFPPVSPFGTSVVVFTRAQTTSTDLVLFDEAKMQGLISRLASRSYWRWFSTRNEKYVLFSQESVRGQSIAKFVSPVPKHLLSTQKSSPKLEKMCLESSKLAYSLASLRLRVRRGGARQKGATS
jgi:hypothetical protein